MQHLFKRHIHVQRLAKCHNVFPTNAGVIAIKEVDAWCAFAAVICQHVRVIQNLANGLLEKRRLSDFNDL